MEPKYEITTDRLNINDSVVVSRTDVRFAKIEPEPLLVSKDKNGGKIMVSHVLRITYTDGSVFNITFNVLEPAIKVLKWLNYEAVVFEDPQNPIIRYSHEGNDTLQ